MALLLGSSWIGC